jgi:hypothetical protein
MVLNVDGWLAEPDRPAKLSHAVLPPAMTHDDAAGA